MTIIHIADSVNATLGMPTKPAYPLDGTMAATTALDIERREGFATGLWECTPGKFLRQSPKAEMMHVIAGSCTFTPVGAETIHIKTGDTVFFPEKTEGTWEITETLRKVFAVLG